MDAEDRERVHEMMFGLCTWFFSIDTLTLVANYTNDKATEVVNKTRHRDKTGRVYYKVGLMPVVHARACMYECRYTYCTRHTYRCMKDLCLAASDNSDARTGND